jgi:signal transduction histidine kinase
VPKKRARKEFSALPEPSASVYTEQRESESLDSESSVIRIRAFESEIDPFGFSLLDSGHFVLFRKVWRDGQRYIQGAVIEQRPFLEGVIKSSFDETTLSRMSDLIVAHQGDVFSVFSGPQSPAYLSSAQELTGALLYRTRLSDPLGDLELIYSINHLPSGPGASVVTWVAVILMLVLCGGFYLMYRLGAKQIELARQQQDFVSAVSHELKTPLTSIRMYGELLREGWASEEKKKSYYDFISDESERLTRLINNVLQLARLTRNRIQAEIRPVSAAELIDNIRSKVSSQIERAGFSLNLGCADSVGEMKINVDVDHFVQIVINLVDNALKFSAQAEKQVIDINCALAHDKHMVFSIRDYGPGVPKDQMKKIFKLFYRSENELTRETVGTGIGLALVHQLAQKMDGQVDVVNRDPGAEFQLSLPLAKQ